MGLTVATMVLALQHEGFEVVATRRAGVHARRTVGQRDDHVALDVESAGPLSRLLRRRRAVTAVHVGQVWRLVEQAFNRPVPDAATIPDEVHLVADMHDVPHDAVASGAGFPDGRGSDAGGSDAGGSDASDAAVVAAVVRWCDRLRTPADVLAAGLPDDPVLRLEFAVVARDRTAGVAAADEARARLSEVRRSRRRGRRRHIDRAVGRLPS